MKTGDIVLIPFPFAELTNKKVRPSVVVCETNDAYKDLILCAISSVITPTLSPSDVLLLPDNGLRKNSLLKIDRIVTAKKEDIIAKIGELNDFYLATFREKFKKLID